MEGKFVEKEEVGKTEISLSSFFAILKNKILLIIAVIVVALAVGGDFAYLNVPKYTASGNLMVNVKLDENKGSQYNDTILAEKLMPTVVEFVTTEVVILRANEIYAEKGIDESQISVSSINIESAENSFIMSIKYAEKFNGDEAQTQLIVKEKLNSLFQAFGEKAQERQEGNSSAFKYFNMSITVSSLQEYPTVTVSNAKLKIMIFALVIGVVLGVAIALLVEYFDETVKSLDDVRKITGVDTIIGMEDLQNRGKK